jgi:energy-coupling factor transporter ATP-binding protein EcfA2
MYYPVLTSELEKNYDIIQDFVNNEEKILNVYGKSGCGKTTVVKLYLNDINYHYIDDYNQQLESFVDFIKKLTSVNVLSYFMGDLKSSIIVIDNYDCFSYKLKDYYKHIKDFKIIIISNIKYFNNSLYIEPPSESYLVGLMYSINAYYNKKYKNLNFDNSFLKFYSSVSHSDKIVFDEFCTDIENIRKIYRYKCIDVSLNDINNIQSTYLYHTSMDNLDNVYSNLSDSITLINYEYYNIINNLIIQMLDSEITSVKKVKLNYHRRNKILKESAELIISPLELSLVKKIKLKN